MNDGFELLLFIGLLIGNIIYLYMLYDSFRTTLCANYPSVPPMKINCCDNSINRESCFVVEPEQQQSGGRVKRPNISKVSSPIRRFRQTPLLSYSSSPQSPTSQVQRIRLLAGTNTYRPAAPTQTTLGYLRSRRIQTTESPLEFPNKLRRI